jgi:hypothetical protein
MESMTVDELMQRWAARTEKLLESALQSQEIGASGGLSQSIKFQTEKAQDQVSTTLSMRRRGRFVDMGAGRNSPANSGKRVAKKWYSKTFYKQLYRLYGMVGRATLEDVRETIKSISDGRV